MRLTMVVTGVKMAVMVASLVRVAWVVGSVMLVSVAPPDTVHPEKA